MRKRNSPEKHTTKVTLVCLQQDPTQSTTEMGNYGSSRVRQIRHYSIGTQTKAQRTQLQHSHYFLISRGDRSTRGPFQMRFLQIRIYNLRMAQPRPSPGPWQAYYGKPPIMVGPIHHIMPLSLVCFCCYPPRIQCTPRSMDFPNETRNQGTCATQEFWFL